MYRVDGVSGLNDFTGINAKFPSQQLLERRTIIPVPGWAQFSARIRLSVHLPVKRSGETSKGHKVCNKFLEDFRNADFPREKGWFRQTGEPAQLLTNPPHSARIRHPTEEQACAAGTMLDGEQERVVYSQINGLGRPRRTSPSNHDVGGCRCSNRSSLLKV